MKFKIIASCLRVEDQEISLNVPDVNKIIAIYESKNAVKPVLDTLKFVSGLSLDTNSIIGEQILGKNSRAVAQIVERSTAEVKVVNLNANTFIGRLCCFVSWFDFFTPKIGSNF